MVTCCIVCFTFSRCLCIEILGNVEFIWFTDFWCKAKLHLNWIIFSFLTATQLEYTWIFNVKHVLYRIIWCWMIFSFLHTVKYCDIHSSNVNDESSNWLWHLIFTIIIIKWKKNKIGYNVKIFYLQFRIISVHVYVLYLIAHIIRVKVTIYIVCAHFRLAREPLSIVVIP